MILFLFSIFNMKKLFSIVSPPTFHLAPRSLVLHVLVRREMMVLTFTPSRDLRCSMDDDVKALVKVAVKNEQRIRPVRIHRMPNKRAGGDFGVLSPYLIFRERTLIDQKLNIPNQKLNIPVLIKYFQTSHVDLISS